MPAQQGQQAVGEGIFEDHQGALRGVRALDDQNAVVAVQVYRVSVIGCRVLREDQPVCGRLPAPVRHGQGHRAVRFGAAKGILPEGRKTGAG